MLARAEIEEHWDEVKQSIRQRWQTLGGEELDEARGSAGHLVGLIQQRTGEPRDDVERFVEGLVARRRPLLSRASYTCRTTLGGHPVSSVLATFGIGFVVGTLISHAIGSRPSSFSRPAETRHRFAELLHAAAERARKLKPS